MYDKNKVELRPTVAQPSGLKIPKEYKTKKIVFGIFAILIAICVGVAVGFYVWLRVQLSPLDPSATQLVQVTIKSGSTTAQIADELENKSIIKSATAFNIYIRYTNKNNSLQAGTYRLSPAESIQQIVGHLINGRVDQFSITFYPGATLTDSYTKDESKKYDVTTVLKRADYSDEEIASALSKTYDSPLFQDKPAGTDLEGYVYGETYNFNVGASVEDILQTTFDEFYADIEANNLIKAFASHGLNLYQGITLASIVQREASDADDQKQVAQVFYSRLDSGMLLGSDVTYQYIADKLGVKRNFNLDSPYNTRRYAGLTPGPIAVPGLSALLAVAEPASSDYLYFLAGDDGVMYFSRTEAEHEQNIAEHCQVGCATQ